MKKIALLSVSAAALFFSSVFLLYLFYLPGVNYYQPINIKLEGLTREQSSQAKVYGITPLFGTPAIINTALSDTNNSAGLFRQVYISFSDAPLDSVSAITVRHGKQTFVLEKNEITQLLDLKSRTLVLPDRTKSLDNKPAKLWALGSALFYLKPLRIIVFPVLLFLLGAVVVWVQKKYGAGLISISGWNRTAHIFIYGLCLAIGLIYMSAFSYSGKVWLGGDSIAYQSIAVNMIYGEGFPLEGGRVDSSAYQMFTDTIPSSATWADFYANSNPPTLYRNPLYPLFVAGVYKVFSVDPKALRIIQFFMLVLAGSLLPYISYKIAGTKGVLPGIFAYLMFLSIDHRYAFEVMSEALIITYIIVLLLAQLVLKYKTNILHAVCFGILLGCGPLLKNYFIPFFLMALVYLVYSVFVLKNTPRKHGLTILIVSLLTIAPWTIYANYQIQSIDPEQGFVFITTQGEDVLINSNNERCVDGEWHSVWQSDTAGYYNQSSSVNTNGFVRVALFYAQHPALITKIFPAKIIKGFMVSTAQLLFYLSVLMWLFGNSISRIKNRRVFKVFLFLISFSLVLSCLFGHFEIFQFAQWKISSLPQFYLPHCLLLVLCTYAFYIYYRQTPKDERKKMLFALLLIANFLALTIIFYGSERINGVIDFIFLLLALQIQFGLLNQEPVASSPPQQTAKSG